MNMRLSDYSVNAKVIAAFACVLLATIALGLFSHFSIDAVNGAAQELGQKNVPKTQQLANLRFNSTRYRAGQGSVLLSAAPELRAAAIERLKENQTLVSNLVDGTTGSAGNDQERAIAQRISEAWAVYGASTDRMLELEKTQGSAAANLYYVTTMQQQFDVLRGVITAGLEYYKSQAAVIAQKSHATYEFADIGNYFAMAVATVLALLSSMLLSRSVSKPLIGLSSVMQDLAQGRMGVAIPFAGEKDEVGQLASAMADFRDQLTAAQREKDEQTKLIVSSIGAGLEQLAAGNLTHRIALALSGPFIKVKDDFNAALERLEGTLHRIADHSHQIANSAGEISEASDTLSRRTEQQAASLEETAAAMEEITQTVRHVAANSREVDKAIATASADAASGGEVVETAIKAMDAIAQSSRQITDIIGVIDEIAFQTNLLALNAGVEAARAGEAGKGFAVVASEVRALAQRSGEAAKQIKTLINASSAYVEDGVKLVGETGQALVGIVEQVHAITGVVREMTGSVEQQATGIGEINTAVTQMDQMTQQNAAMYEETTAAARSLAQETENLDLEISFFQVSGSTAIRHKPVTRRSAA